MATSIMSRSQGIYTGHGDISELLQAGFVQQAFSAAVAQYPSDPFTPKLQDYIQQSAASIVPIVLNASYDAVSWPMDRVSNGPAFLALSSVADNDTDSFQTAATAIRQSIDLNPRTAEGGLWFYNQTDVSYLDGMYSLTLFYTLDSLNKLSSPNTKENATASLDDVILQMDLMWKCTLNATSGLLVHGYDYSRASVWADPATGASPYVWGRSLGWYAMALVNALEVLPEAQDKYREPLLEKLQLLSGALVDHVNPATGAWWQLLDQPGREGNYIESSGSAMFAYTLMKASRLGYLDAALSANATAAGLRGYEYLTDTFVDQQVNGTVGWNGTVAVCSLDSVATYEYYVNQPILYNSVLGSAAYVLAALEAERLGTQ
ncbi:glycoside hydrolase family 105 protein [Hypoxylon sp. CI-4A]|nr:glycoside hydrolase family 105 protein [Hypoxylon sp. CI-4A]